MTIKRTIDIESELLKMIEHCGLDRMPTDKEIREYFGNTELSSAINRQGGLFTWGEKMGLKLKESSASMGHDNELLVKSLLESRGYTCIKTRTKHPYDLLVNGCVKVDVKSARLSKVKTSDVYSFKLAKPQQTCDVYVTVCLDDNEVPTKIYVIPAHVMTGKTQLVMGVGSSKYDEYIEKWEIIDNLIKSFEEMTHGGHQEQSGQGNCLQDI